MRRFGQNLTTLLLAVLLFILSTVGLAPSTMAAGDFKPCCRDGSSPYASESRDTLKSNSRAELHLLQGQIVRLRELKIKRSEKALDEVTKLLEWPMK